MDRDYDNKRALYRRLMDEFNEEVKRKPMSIGQMADRMADIYEQAFPIKRELPDGVISFPLGRAGHGRS